MNHPTGDREVEALIVDRYLEALLARRPADLADLPPSMRASALALHGELPRFHPSFRFEEALAGRLAAAARAAREGADRAQDGALVELVRRPAAAPAAVRPVLIGGVLTSAVLSLIGAVYMAWRWTHPSPQAAMARAVRAVARARAV